MPVLFIFGEPAYLLPIAVLKPVWCDRLGKDCFWHITLRNVCIFRKHICVCVGLRFSKKLLCRGFNALLIF